MREIDQVRITLLRLFRGAVQVPEEIINEMLKAFIHTRNAAIKVRTISKGWLVRFNPYDYMDDAASNVFAAASWKQRDDQSWVGLTPSMVERNGNMMYARWKYRDALHHRWSLNQLIEHDSRRTALRALRRRLSANCLKHTLRALRHRSS